MAEQNKERNNGGARGSGAKKGTFGRLLKYIFKYYPAYVITVVICIVVSALASTVSTVFLQRLIDQAITPGLTKGLAAVWKPLLTIIGMMGIFYAVGVLATWIYTHLMATVTQGTLKHMRDDMFGRMESLPISTSIHMRMEIS